MLCSQCNNLLQKTSESGKLKYFCRTCGSEYPCTGDDSLISSEDDVTFHITKPGRVIYHYPSNQKEFQDCANCGEKIVAFDIINNTKIYGCRCGNVWKITRQH